MSFAAAQYRTAQLNTASPVQLVVQLYDAAIRFMTHALAAIEQGEPGVRNQKLQRSHAIVSELQTSLIHAHEPDLCRDLDRLYDFVLFCIKEAVVAEDRAKLEGAVRVLRDLRGAWAEVAKG